MNQRILYNFASRSRPKAFYEVIENIKAMSASDNYFIVAKFDTDDPELPHYLIGDGFTKDQQQWHCQRIVFRLGLSHSKIHAINRDILDEGYHWDIIVNISDDQRFTVKGFDNIIRAHCGTDSFVHFPDPYKKAACSTMSVMDRIYFNRTGQIYHPDYFSLWADVEATEIAKLLGQYVYVPTTIHKHLHFSTGALMDALYARNNTYKQDRKVYDRRRGNNFYLPFPKTPYLLIKYATRGRWRLFFQAIDNIYATIRTNQFKIVVTADNDDVEMNNTQVRDWVKRYHNVELWYGDHKSKVEAINADFNPATNWYWCVNTSDDMKFISPGWDVRMLNDIQEVWGTSTDFFAHFNDNYVGEKLPTMNICGREYYNRFGYIYDPSYKSVSCDAENMYVAMMLGRYHYFPEVYFSHEHSSNLNEPTDNTYMRNHVHGQPDTDNYFKRLKQYFLVKDPVIVPEEMKPYL